MDIRGEDEFRSMVTFVDKHQVIIFKLDKKKNPIQFGSGVFVERNNEYYLVSCAHVLRPSATMYINIGNGTLTPLNGVTAVLSNSNVKEKDKPSKNDLAIMKIFDNLQAQIKKIYSFVPIQVPIIKHQIEYKKDSYLVVASRSNNVKINRSKNQITPVLSSIVSYIRDDIKWEKLNYDADLHICLNYPKRFLNLQEKKRALASNETHGMSGAGLWHFQRSNKIMKISLIGILMEINIQIQRCLVAVEISQLERLFLAIKGIDNETT